jgi:hypothetical protein
MQNAATTASGWFKWHGGKQVPPAGAAGPECQLSTGGVYVSDGSHLQPTLQKPLLQVLCLRRRLNQGLPDCYSIFPESD